jgi:hypothetical protein
MTRTGYCNSVRGIVITVLVLITTSLTYEDVYCWSSVYRPHTALTCSVLNLVMSEKVYIYIYIYLTEWVLENWWYENRTRAVTLAPMPLWTSILISTLSFTLISVLHIDVNGTGSTAPSDVCANKPICASNKGWKMWFVWRIFCDFCTNSIFLKADNVRPLYWFNRSSIKFLTMEPFCVLCIHAVIIFVLPLSSKNMKLT